MIIFFDSKSNVFIFCVTTVACVCVCICYVACSKILMLLANEDIFWKVGTFLAGPHNLHGLYEGDGLVLILRLGLGFS